MPTEEEILNSINSNPYHGPQPDLDDKDNKGNASKKGEFLSFIWETAKIIIISLVIIVPIRYYLVQPFFVKGASMEENFHDGDYLLIDEISYRFNEPSRGDVIVFRYPENPSQFYIKRIIGLPGETVEVRSDKVIIYNDANKNGFTPKEYYLSENQITMGNVKEILGPDEYFVMGDNRLQSSDSRRWGSVPKSLIIGRVFLRLWPFNDVTAIKGITY